MFGLVRRDIEIFPTETIELVFKQDESLLLLANSVASPLHIYRGRGPRSRVVRRRQCSLTSVLSAPHGSSRGWPSLTLHEQDQALSAKVKVRVPASCSGQPYNPAR